MSDEEIRQLCSECGKLERDSHHIRYGNDVDNEAKHWFKAPASPAPALTGDKLKQIAMRHCKGSTLTRTIEMLANTTFDWDAIVQDPKFPRGEKS